MTVFLPDPHDEESRIHRFEASPNKPDAPMEAGRMGAFRKFIEKAASYFRKKGEMADDLAERYATAEVEQREAGTRRSDSEAVKFGSEAVEAAARAEEARANAAKAQVEVATTSNQEVTRILQDDTLTDEAKALQLLNLIDRDPSLLEALQKLHAIKQRLRLTRGTVIEERAEDHIFQMVLGSAASGTLYPAVSRVEGEITVTSFGPDKMVPHPGKPLSEN